jgi:hypothetical protein
MNGLAVSSSKSVSNRLTMNVILVEKGGGECHVGSI